MNIIKNLYIKDKNIIDKCYLDVLDFDNSNNLYYSDKNIEHLNQNNFIKNTMINSNFDKSNYNYFNIQHLKKGYETNQNIENNNKNYLDLKDNNKDLMALIKQNNLSINNNKNKLKKKLSKYRGVTRNKKKWQVCISIKGKNTYLGSYNSEIKAAKIYDLIAIKKKGKNAKTNFKYNIQRINEISEIDININNIFDIISNIFLFENSNKK